MSSSHDITLTPQEQALIMRLKSFRVPEMAHILEEQLKDPNADLNTFLERMTAMVDAEWQARADKRFNRLMKEAHLRYPAADLDETIYRPERQLDTQTIERLSTCHWIEEGKNLIVTGSSASGKTYLINAFCVTAMKQSKSVKYIKANTLMSEMEQARIKSTNLDYLNKLTKLDLLVIDDFGLMDLDLDKCRDLFEVLDTRDGRKSTVVISQFPVSTWFDMFADNTYADACLFHFTHKCVRFYILYTLGLLHCSYAKSIDQIRFSTGRRTCYNEIFSFFYPMAGTQTFYCLGIKLTFWTVNGFIKICRRVSQMCFFHQTIKAFICPCLPLCINHCCHAFHKRVQICIGIFHLFFQDMCHFRNAETLQTHDQSLFLGC